MPTTFCESLWRTGNGKVQGNREKSGGKIVRRQSKNDLMTGIPGSLQETDRNNEMRFFFSYWIYIPEVICTNMTIKLLKIQIDQWMFASLEN